MNHCICVHSRAMHHDIPPASCAYPDCRCKQFSRREPDTLGEAREIEDERKAEGEARP